MQPNQLQNAWEMFKNNKHGPEQVHMGLLGAIFAQHGSHRLLEASGMPPDPKINKKNKTNPGFQVWGPRGLKSLVGL